MDEQKQQCNGAGYPFTSYRVEWRPIHRLDTKEELTEVLDLLQECGVKAWWYSVSAKGSYPLFESKFLPYRADADTDLYLWLVEEAHRRGISLFSWEYLNTAPLLTEKYPEWTYGYFDWEGPNSLRDDHFVCHNSPYGELLKGYCVEVVNDLGFDGIWFDGCYMFSNSNQKMACCCPYCQEKYHRETGRSIPGTIDWNSVDFRAYMEWRYRDFTAYWTELSRYIKEKNKNAIIIFNYFNRFGHEYMSGSPLQHMPMEGMIASESCSQPQQLLLQHKILRALNDNYPTEVWDYMRDAAQVSNSIPNPVAESVLFHGECSGTAGGFPSFGIGSHPRDFTQLMKILRHDLDPIAPYVGGKQFPCIGLVVSGATKDYGCISADGKTSNPWPAWQAVHGMHNLLNSLHLPSEVLLDNMLIPEYTHRYQMIVLSDIQCLSDPAAKYLKEYVENGGSLLITGKTGIKNRLGEVRERGVLDDLLDITWRDSYASRPVLEEVEGALEAKGLPGAFMISGEGYLVRSQHNQVLAVGRYRPGTIKNAWTPKGAAQNENEEVRGEGILQKKIGKGHILYFAQNIGRGYAQQPGKRTREVVRAFLEEWIRRPFETDAPANVAITMWEKEGKTVFHILHLPDRLLHIPEGGGGEIYPEDFVLAGVIRISLEGEWKQVFSPKGTEIQVEQKAGKAIITVIKPQRHEVIVLANE